MARMCIVMATKMKATWITTNNWVVKLMWKTRWKSEVGQAKKTQKERVKPRGLSHFWIKIVQKRQSHSESLMRIPSNWKRQSSKYRTRKNWRTLTWDRRTMKTLIKLFWRMIQSKRINLQIAMISRILKIWYRLEWE